MAHITKNGNKFSFQLRVPKDLVPAVGKSMIKIPLGTSDRRQAEIFAGRLLAEHEARFNALRDGQAIDDMNVQLAPVGYAVLPGEDAAAALKRISAENTDRASYIQAGAPYVLDYLRFVGLSLVPEDLAKLQDIIDTERARAVATTATIKQIAKDHGHDKPLLVAPRVDIDPDNPPLSHLYKMRGAQYGRSKGYEAEKSVRQFEELHGKIGVKDITPARIRQFRDALLSLPLKLGNEDAKKPLPELLEKLKDHGGPVPTNATIKAKLSPISALLTYAADEGLIESNPAIGIKSTKGRASSRRPPFDRVHLETIFGLPMFSAPERSELAWFHILEVYTGARPAELIQLESTDIKPMPVGIDGYYISIHEIGADRSVKTENSVRRVPVHPGLAATGFVEWARSRKGLIFAGLQNGDGEKRQTSDKVSKAGNALIHDDADIPAPWCLYSYRHTMQDAGRDSGLDRGTIDAFVGREDQTSGGGYGDGYALGTLAQAVARIRLPADLSHLNRR